MTTEPTLAQDEISRLRSDLAVRPSVQEGWQLIETAPKDDGVAVLAYDPTADSRLVVWWCDNDMDWLVAWTGAANPDITHWMPLPAAPQPNAKEEG